MGARASASARHRHRPMRRARPRLRMQGFFQRRASRCAAERRFHAFSRALADGGVPVAARAARQVWRPTSPYTSTRIGAPSTPTLPLVSDAHTLVEARAPETERGRAWLGAGQLRITHEHVGVMRRSHGLSPTSCLEMRLCARARITLESAPWIFPPERGGFPVWDVWIFGGG